MTAGRKKIFPKDIGEKWWRWHYEQGMSIEAIAERSGASHDFIIKKIKEAKNGSS